MRDDMNDRTIEEWAKAIRDEAQQLVDVLGEAQDARHLLRPSERVGALADQWYQPPLDIPAAERTGRLSGIPRPTEDIVMDERRLALRSEVTSLGARLKEAYILVSGMRRGIERRHNEWKKSN